MMLGKRTRPPMKRTTSMTEFTLDFTVGGGVYQPLDPHNPFNGVDQHYSSSAASTRVTPQRRNSADFFETASFLRVCSLCKRGLIPGRDIYMYKGDSAFCSLECRQQQMTQDERKDKKCSVASSKKKLDANNNAAAAAAAAAVGPQTSATGERVAAAV